MKPAFIIIAVAALFLGCSRQDPIDRLMTRVETEPVPSYLFQPIQLPTNATPDQCIAVLTKRGEVHVQKILETRPAHTAYESFTAVRFESDAGQKILLLQPLPKSTNRWYYRIYDVK
jgi:hypothetical protein